jgi:hypothetical protein
MYMYIRSKLLKYTRHVKLISYFTNVCISILQYLRNFIKFIYFLLVSVLATDLEW